MFDAHVYAYYRAPYRMVMLSRWPPWQESGWTPLVFAARRDQPACTLYFLCRLLAFNFFSLFLFYHPIFSPVFSISPFWIIWRQMSIWMWFFFLFHTHRIHTILLADFCSCEDLRVISIKIFENVRHTFPLGEHCVSTNYSVRKKLHARLHGI